MWFDVDMIKVDEFVYQTPVPPWLTEHEYLHLFFWKYTGQDISPDPKEVIDYTWVTRDDMLARVEEDDPTLGSWTKFTWKHISDKLEHAYEQVMNLE